MFTQDLAVGHAAETAIRDELNYHGIPTIPTTGKNDFDFFLPDGRSAEAKLDIFSMRTSNAAIEWPTLNRKADVYFHCFTYCRVYTHEQYQWLYNHGKIPAHGLGERHYDGRYVSKMEMRNQGVFLDEFIKSLKQQ